MSSGPVRDRGLAGRHREGLSAGRGLLLRGPARFLPPPAAVFLPLPAAHPRPLRRREAAPVPCRGPSSAVAPGRRHPTSALPQRRPRCLWRPLTAPHRPRPPAHHRAAQPPNGPERHFRARDGEQRHQPLRRLSGGSGGHVAKGGRASGGFVRDVPPGSDGAARARPAPCGGGREAAAGARRAEAAISLSAGDGSW